MPLRFGQAVDLWIAGLNHVSWPMSGERHSTSNRCQKYRIYLILSARWLGLGPRDVSRTHQKKAEIRLDAAL